MPVQDLTRSGAWRFKHSPGSTRRGFAQDICPGYLNSEVDGRAGLAGGRADRVPVYGVIPQRRRRQCQNPELRSGNLGILDAELSTSLTQLFSPVMLLQDQEPRTPPVHPSPLEGPQCYCASAAELPGTACIPSNCAESIQPCLLDYRRAVVSNARLQVCASEIGGCMFQRGRSGPPCPSPRPAARAPNCT